jgi:hypothetical protein
MASGVLVFGNAPLLKRWGRKDYTELTGEDGGAIRIDVATDELERKILEIASKRVEEIEE